MCYRREYGSIYTRFLRRILDSRRDKNPRNAMTSLFLRFEGRGGDWVVVISRGRVWSLEQNSVLPMFIYTKI